MTYNRNKQSKLKRVYSVVCIVIMTVFVVASLSGCESVSSWIQTVKGELIGNSYEIWEYDNFGNKILTLHGDKITMDGGTDKSGEASSYIDITVDGYEWNHVGNTLVFAQKGTNMITDFQIPEELNSTGSSTGLMGVDRVINSYKNMIGMKKVVVVFSQTGAPICMFQGDSCYTEVPEDLPKTTKISIDGKLVYVHRANVDILPAALFNNGQ